MDDFSDTPKSLKQQNDSQYRQNDTPKQTDEALKRQDDAK
jgi:hypothetical protein